MTQSGTQWYEQTERRIKEAQKKIREEGIKTPLINMVSIDSLGMLYNEDFGRRYSGMSQGEAFDRHAEDLERVARGEEDQILVGDLFG